MIKIKKSLGSLHFKIEIEAFKVFIYFINSFICSVMQCLGPNPAQGPKVTSPIFLCSWEFTVFDGCMSPNIPIGWAISANEYVVMTGHPSDDKSGQCPLSTSHSSTCCFVSSLSFSVQTTQLTGDRVSCYMMPHQEKQVEEPQEVNPVVNFKNKSPTKTNIVCSKLREKWKETIWLVSCPAKDWRPV